MAIITAGPERFSEEKNHGESDRKEKKKKKLEKQNQAAV